MAKNSKEVIGTYKCRHCGKWIKADSFDAFQAGSYCHLIRDEQGWTQSSILAHRMSMSSTDVPKADDGRPYVKVAAITRSLRKAGIPVSRLVRAFGNDRSLNGAMHPKFLPTYVGRVRYLHPDCGEEWGISFLLALGGRKGK